MQGIHAVELAAGARLRELPGRSNAPGSHIDANDLGRVFSQAEGHAPISTSKFQHLVLVIQPGNDVPELGFQVLLNARRCDFVASPKTI
jgi:hypothetical protein